MKFGFKDLQVWNRAVQFAVEVIDIFDDLQCERKHYRLIEQIESSATSIAQPISLGEQEENPRKS